MEIDVRGNVTEVITGIRFGMPSLMYWTEPPGVSNDKVAIATNYRGLVSVSDIDNLIKALEKAKELWEIE